MAEPISRRHVLVGTGAAAGAVALGSYAVAQRQTPRSQAAPEPAYRFFTAQEGQFIEAAVDQLFPPDPVWPGARTLGVPTYIDLQLSGPYGAGSRLYLQGPIRPAAPQFGYQLGLSPARLYRESLGSIAVELDRRRLDFAAAPSDQKDAFLHSLEAGELQLGEGFSSAIFFETLLANTIEGVFADPAYGGNRDMMAWRMIGFPGAYAAYVDLYTRHGMGLDREPISMVSHAGHGHHGSAGHR